MPVTEPIRVAVTGAAGQISYALLFRIASGGLFGPNQPVALSLHDTPAARPFLDATMMELHDSAFPLLRAMDACDDTAGAFAGADWIILLASAPLRPGMSRTDLLLANAPIFQEQGRAINEAAPSARVLTVANPCNTNCLIARSMARDSTDAHWFAMTRLDQSRARAMLADRAGVPVDQVARMTVWGNHGRSIFPDFHNATIADRPAPEVIRDEAWVRHVFEPALGERGVHLFAARGASPAGSAAQAIIASIRSLVTPTPFGHRFSAAVLSDGSYGVPRNLVFSCPLRTEDGESWSIVQGLYLDGHAQDRLRANVAELELEASAVIRWLGNVR